MINNWPFIVDHIVEASGHNVYVMIYFVSFLVIINVIIVKLVLGLVVDAVLSF